MKNSLRKLIAIILTFVLAAVLIPVITPVQTRAASVRIAICGTYTSETYQVDDDIWSCLEELGASVTKVSSSVDVSQYDGLLVPGGIDIDPAMYGESDYACDYTDISFDREQTAIIDKFVNAGKPILGVCRGFELLNVYFGGSLYQDVDGHRSSHTVTSKAGSALYEACGSGFTVSSAHHQAIKALGSGLIDTQWAPDGIIEAAEHVSLPIIGVLWHPEWSGSSGYALLRYFLNMCQKAGPDVVYQNGEWVYINEYGNVDYTFTGLAPNEYGWWRIENGWVNFGYEGFAENEYGIWYLEGGCVQFGVDRVIWGNVGGTYAWWHVSGGAVTFDTTVAPNEYGWWYVRDGQVDFSYTGLAPNNYGWWRIENGMVNFGYEGIVPNEYGWWYVKGGAVQFGADTVAWGNVNGIDAWWHVSGGAVTFDTTLAANEYGWWYINDGQVDFSFTGLVPNDFGWWAVENGRINFDYYGLAANDFGTWYISGGSVDFSYTGTWSDGNTEYNIVGGKVE